MKLYFNVLCLFFLPLLLSTKGKMPDPIVTINDGKLRGTIGRNIDGQTFYKFLGIPYAKPPLGELRFKPPHPTEPWTGIREAKKIGNTCLSRDGFTREIVGSEDCLYLNVYTRTLPAKDKPLRPVMVYIHGGGLILGSSDPRIYGPEFLMLKDIVLVIFNYRLGVLGFLSFDNPKLQVTGNMGLKDQNLALKWVQQNIQSFNGNPNDITIFGNSAGSSSVHAHILSPASKGLFHKAIMQSGTALNSWFWGSKNNAKELVRKAGKTADTDREALDILKNMTAEEIFAAQEQIYDSPYPADRRPFSAVIEIPNDTSFITRNPVDVIKSGAYSQVPTVIGYTETEGMLLDLDNLAAKKVGLEIPSLDLKKVIPVSLNTTQEDVKKILTTLKELYQSNSTSSRHDPMTDGFFLVAIIETLKLHLENALKPIYLYRMSLHGELNQGKIQLNNTNEPGVCHSDELGYLFNTEITPPIKPGTLEDRSLRKFVELWTNFAIYGNPSPSDLIWKPIEDKNDLELLDIGEQIRMEKIPERDRLNVWSGILQKWPMVRF